MDQPQQNFLNRDEVSGAFVARGWVRAAGGHLYYDGYGKSEHPHLHLIVEGFQTVRVGGDIRNAVRMLAVSDGQQGNGGGGRTYIRDGLVHEAKWRELQPVTALVDEFSWVMIGVEARLGHRDRR